VRERLGIAGSGAIATGLAATAAQHHDVVIWARSGQSAERALASVDKACGKLEAADAQRVKVETDLDALASATFVVEAVVEDHDTKAGLLRDLASLSDGTTVLATTTSSLSIQALGRASGIPDRFVGLHVFNPVPKMPLVELVFPQEASPDTRERARSLCEHLEKTAVEVPDVPGFVVNRLLFPYLFSAVDLMDETGLAPDDIDRCMNLGAGHPMGPLALLDFVGLDVAVAIGETIGTPIPERMRSLVAEGALGRKTGHGLYPPAG
jgi:3-hydroxybutyryl-CoA dehydrogenase